MENNKIFVQIAAYRDPDLNNTLKSLYENAFFPEQLRVVVANQFAEGDDPVDEYPGLEVLNIPYQQVYSACWVRNRIQQEYNDEAYTLQLDSHMRFVEGWDVLLRDWYTRLKAKGKNPLITGYVPSFDPLNDPAGRAKVPYIQHFDFFAVDGWVSFRPTTLDDYKNYDEPLPARFYSAHFAFADGAFSTKVQHDPQMYFHGEEISIGVRAYTHGYDLYHPHRLICFHDYSRKLRRGNKRLQWDNDPKWGEKNKKSFHRMRILLGMEEGNIDFQIYGLGTERTVAEFEQYAGIKFSTRESHPDSIQRKPPGLNKQSRQEWESELVTFFKHTINIHRNDLDPTVQDYDLFVVAYHSQDGDTLFRQDVEEPQIPSLLAKFKDEKGDLAKLKQYAQYALEKYRRDNQDPEWRKIQEVIPSVDAILGKIDGEGDKDDWLDISREFYPEKKPAYWVFIPRSKSRGWLNRIQRDLPV